MKNWAACRIWSHRPGRVCALLNAPIPHVAVENPMPHRYARELIGNPTQWIQPHDYGDPVLKRTGLWLRGLPILMADEDATAATYARPPAERMPTWWGAGGRTGRARSLTSPGIATAMARQWGDWLQAGR